MLWQAVEDYENMSPGHENSNWGLIQTDFTPRDAAREPLRKNKKYWAMANYSRFIRPGARVINTDDATTTAALRPGGRGAVVVHTNPTDTDRDVTVDLGGFAKVGPGPAERYTTDPTKNVRRERDVPVRGKSFKATVGARSVTTFVLPGVSGVDPGAATAPTGAPRQVVGDQSGMALAAQGADGRDGVVQRRPDRDDPAQRWTFTKRSGTDWGTTATYRVTNEGTGRSLAVDNGRLVLTEPGASPRQEWMRSTGGDGRATLVNKATGQLLDVTHEATHDGAPVGVHRPTAGANQSWTFRDPADSSP